MAHRTHRNTGFTLVEILIVVVILGILAAIVIPQFTNASESAKSSSLTTQLQTIRSQLELFQVQHNGTYPDLVAGGWDVMSLKTGATDTAAAATDQTASGLYGPYLQQAPVNPFTNTSTVATDTSAAWEYDKTTGVIKANVPLTATQVSDMGLSTNDVNATGS